MALTTSIHKFNSTVTFQDKRIVLLQRETRDRNKGAMSF